MDYARIEDRIAETGLIVRGGFYPGPEDDVPLPCATLILVGNAGAGFWRAFEESADTAVQNPIEDWTGRILTKAARELGAEVLFPFTGPPFLPFLNWAQKAEPVFPSPIGPMIHPEYGLWHAYRGALLFSKKIALPDQPDIRSPCEACSEKPCLTACPVDAVGPAGFQVAACAGYLAVPDGTNCLSVGCAARRACPVGRDYLYHPPQAHYHMQAFLETYGPGWG